MTLSRPRPVTPPCPENTVLVQGPTHPQKSVGELLSHRDTLQGGDNFTNAYSRGTVRAPELGPDHRHLWALAVLTHLNLDLGWACGVQGGMQENVAIENLGSGWG